MSLSHDEVNELASLGIALQYVVKDYNTTAVDLAAKLLTSLKADQLYQGKNVTEMVRSNIGSNSNDTVAATLGKFPSLADDNLGSGVAVGWILMFIISGIVVGMRFFSKVYFKLGLRRDDWVLLLAWLTSTANNLEDIYVYLAHNWGAHCWNMSLSDINAHYRIAAVDGFLMFISAFLFKSALLLFYFDLYPAKGFRVATYTMGFVVTSYMVFGITWSAVRCKPFDTWNHPYTYVCMPSELALIYALTAVNVPIDLVIVGMPIIAIRVLALRPSERWALLSLISIAGCVCIASIVRLTTLQEYIDSADVSRRAIPATTWSLVEVHLGVVCVSVPALRKLVQLWVRKTSFGGRANHVPTPTNDTSFAGSVVEIWQQACTGVTAPELARDARGYRRDRKASGNLMTALTSTTTTMTTTTTTMTLGTDVETGTSPSYPRKGSMM